MSVGGKVTSTFALRHSSWTASTSSTQIDIHTPLSPDAVNSPVAGTVLLPRPPWPSRQRKISHAPEPTAPKPGGSPQSQTFFHPRLSNHLKLCPMSETLRIGVSACAIMQ